MSDYYLRDKIVKCRKRHRCAWCGQWINDGESAFYRVYRFDGEFLTDYQHPECHEALCKSDIGSDGFSFGEMGRGKTMEESDL